MKRRSGVLHADDTLMSCLYCGKKRGLALFRKDGFCSAEHRQLWQERESSNLVKRLTDTPDVGNSQSLRLPERPAEKPSAADASTPPKAKLLEGSHPAQPPSSIVPIVISRRPICCTAYDIRRSRILRTRSGGTPSKRRPSVRGGPKGQATEATGAATANHAACIA